MYVVHELIRVVHEKKKKHLYACFVDLKKAFDLVLRSLLKVRLLEYGVWGRVYDAYTAMYERPRCVVRVNRELTDSFDSLYRVYPGDFYLKSNPVQLLHKSPAERTQEARCGSKTDTQHGESGSF